MLNIVLKDDNDPLKVFAEVHKGIVYLSTEESNGDGHTIAWIDRDGYLILEPSLQCLAKYGLKLDDEGRIIIKQEGTP